ncbi:hypothetical protein D4T97_014345 [Siminovitchia acidinfaciens]|uniref:DUF5316 domain-containing protein n=1 Tax=Siminovitchia acidinfaciens TaxID=2321395 RepID=A0A429XX30_9BACI|nr:DUF5316 domain-containing protein [Siminovitchia acidinfaciens]RST73058.1 hypothetical protein D4T97_014345 [Siminovitchia acidinfaciens]
MKYFLIGILLSVVALCITVIGIDKVVLVNGGIGLFFLALSMITSGSLVSGDRMRANFTSETMEERHKRTSVSMRLVLLGLPNIVAAACFLYFF